ncbi:MAG: DegT/DnrJ/EryC1/StrS family aminotransferase [Bacteroidales bacterium]|nr:DegT/DnrJ/EryC1/StrS family aminotransferase [Bacteroidales bacterium]
MKKIEMVDIRSQYQRLKPEIDAGIAEVLDSSVFIKGPALKAFRDELAAYLSVPYVMPCANGTDALQIALMALKLQPGDEVITSNFTFISTVEVLVLLGLKPVLADVDPLTFNIDPEKLKQAITPRTRAIVPVHLFGQPADMYQIQKIAGEHGLFIIEDNAQSLGSVYTGPDGTSAMTGTIGNIGTTSFFPTKPLACYGDGGALFTTDPHLAEIIEMIINHGAKVKYHHEMIGVNSRLDTIQAAILRVNLRNLDDFIERRRTVAEYYHKRLGSNPAIRIPQVASFGTHVYHQYTILLDPKIRDSVRKQLKEKGIPSMVYYPVPLSIQKAFAFAGYHEGDFPVTEHLCKSVLSLPIHTEMDVEQLDTICSTLLNIINHE